MRKLIPALGLTVLMSGTAARAEPPTVVADIAPVHSLVAMVMDGVGTPALIVQPGVSPHGYTLRPSDARALQEADLVFWVSAGLTPALGKTIDTLSSRSVATELMTTTGTLQLAFEEDHETASSDHDDEHTHDDEHAHDHEGADGIDPHGWLDPRNAMTWVNVVATKLSDADPENAATYRANAANALKELNDLTTEVKARLAPLHQTPFITFHDAYRYFEAAFDLRAAGSITISDASPPSPARIAEIKTSVTALGVHCVLAEPQFNAGLVKTVMDGTGANTAEIDPLGSGLTPGAGLYPSLIRSLADTLATCLSR